MAGAIHRASLSPKLSLHAPSGGWGNQKGFKIQEDLLGLVLVGFFFGGVNDKLCMKMKQTFGNHPRDVWCCLAGPQELNTLAGSDLGSLFGPWFQGRRWETTKGLDEIQL